MTTLTPTHTLSGETPDPVPERSRIPGIALSVTTFVLSVAAFAFLAPYVLTTRAGQERDQSAMEAVYGDEGAVRSLLSVLGYISIGSTGVVLTIWVVLALLRRRYAAAAGAVTIVAGANLTTQALKSYVLQRDDFGHLTVVSLPSGHTTVVISVVLAGLLVTPFALRFAVTLLGTFAVTLTGASTVVAQWHRPADIFAALLVSLAWGGLVMAVLSVRRAGQHPTSGLTHAWVSLVGAIVAGLLLIVIGVRPGDGWDGLGEAGLVLGGMGLASALTVSWFARLSASHSV